MKNADDKRDILVEALARLKSDGPAAQPPEALVEETLRRLAEAGTGADGPQSPAAAPGNTAPVTLRTIAVRFSLAAAAMIALGFAIGRWSGPAPMDVDKLREALAPSVAAAIEPAIRARLVADMHQRYQVALAAAYVQTKEELTEQYRDDLNRFAVQFLAASNAATNRLLADMIESIDTAQTQDLSRISRALYRIEQNRIEDRTQFAAGLYTLASRTEDELSRTQRALVQLAADYQAEGLDSQTPRSTRIPNERNQP